MFRIRIRLDPFYFFHPEPFHETDPGIIYQPKSWKISNIPPTIPLNGQLNLAVIYFGCQAKKI